MRKMPRRPVKPAVVYPVANVIGVTLKILEARGQYVSQKMSESTREMPTSHWVLDALKNNKFPDLAEIVEQPEYRTKIAAIIAHFQVTSPTDDFLTKVQEILSIGVVSDRMIGYIVALPHLYDRISERTGKLIKYAEKYANSRYIGQIGQREEFFVKILDFAEFSKKQDDGSNVDLVVYRFADRDGNFGYFFANEKHPIEQWDCVVLKATPKNHAVNKETGLRETQFSRVRVVENVGKGSEE